MARTVNHTTYRTHSIIGPQTHACTRPPLLKTLQLHRVAELQTERAMPKQIIKRYLEVFMFSDTKLHVYGRRFIARLFCLQLGGRVLNSCSAHSCTNIYWPALVDSRYSQQYFQIYLSMFVRKIFYIA